MELGRARAAGLEAVRAVREPDLGVRARSRDGAAAPAARLGADLLRPPRAASRGAAERAAHAAPSPQRGRVVPLLRHPSGQRGRDGADGAGPARPRRDRARQRRLVPERDARTEGRRLLRPAGVRRSEEHTSELQSRQYLVCRLLLEKIVYLPYDCTPVSLFHATPSLLPCFLMASRYSSRPSYFRRFVNVSY